MILTSSGFLFPLITVPYVSRVLSTFGTGSVAFAQSVVSYFSLAALLGIPVYGIRECARVRDNREELSKTVQELVTILLISSAVVYLAFLVAIYTVPKLHADVPLMLIFSSVIWLSSCGVDWFYQAIEQYGYITIRNIAMKLLGLVLMFIFVHQLSDYRIYGAIVVIASYGSNILNMLRLRKFITFSAKRHLELKRHFKPMAAFTISSISSGMYTQIDLILVGFLGTTNMVGLYQLVVKIKGLCGSAVNSVGNVMLPRLSYYESKGDKDKTIRLMSKNLNFLAITGIGLIAVLILCSKPIVLILGGNAFVDSSVPLMFISPALLFSSANWILSQYLIATENEHAYAAVNFAGFVIAALYCSFLIPRFGIVGAAISITGCEFTVLLVRIFILREFLKKSWKYLDLGKILLASATSFIPGIILSRVLRSAHVFISLLIPSMVFILAYFTFLVITKESFIREIIKHKR